jgi:Fe-S cluster assembly iron-binding protein IscA
MRRAEGSRKARAVARGHRPEVPTILTITQQAAAVLVENRRSAAVPDTYGVRIFAAIPPGGGVRGVAVAFVPEAEPGDEVTEQEGVTAFVPRKSRRCLTKPSSIHLPPMAARSL